MSCLKQMITHCLWLNIFRFEVSSNKDAKHGTHIIERYEITILNFVTKIHVNLLYTKERVLKTWIYAFAFQPFYQLNNVLSSFYLTCLELWYRHTSAKVAEILVSFESIYQVLQFACKFFFPFRLQTRCSSGVLNHCSLKFSIWGIFHLINTTKFFFTCKQIRRIERIYVDLSKYHAGSVVFNTTW